MIPLAVFKQPTKKLAAAISTVCKLPLKGDKIETCRRNPAVSKAASLCFLCCMPTAAFSATDPPLLLSWSRIGCL